MFDYLQSHHQPRDGPFELNDIFAIINVVPAIALLSYGFFNKGLFPGLCFGAVSISQICKYIYIYIIIYPYLIDNINSTVDRYPVSVNHFLM